MAVDADGNVYVVDSGNNRIQKFDSNGTYLSQFGSSGSGNGQFTSPQGIAVDTAGNIYVADSANQRIEKFDSNGNFLFKFGTPGSTPGLLGNTYGVAVDTAGNIYVADPNNNRIQKFNSGGLWVLVFPTSSNSVEVDAEGHVFIPDSGNAHGSAVDVYDAENGTLLTSFGYRNLATDIYNQPFNIAIDPILGNYYVTDNGNGDYKKYHSVSGDFILPVSSLRCGTEYHYQAFATNSYGTGTGEDKIFTTLPCTDGGIVPPPILAGGTTGGVTPSVGETPTVSSPAANNLPCPYFITYHKLKDSGPEIEKIQRFLIQQGYYAGPITGYYGEQTLAAVKNFQTEFRSEVLSPWGLAKATGRWYQSTRHKANAIIGCNEDTIKLDNGVVLK